MGTSFKRIPLNFLCLLLSVGVLFGGCGTAKTMTSAETSDGSVSVSTEKTQNNSESKPDSDVGTLKPMNMAEQFLQNNDDDALLIVFSNILAVSLPRESEAKDDITYKGFNSPKEISSNGLFNFYLTVVDDTAEQYYDETQKLYVIPLKAVTDVLDMYFEGYSFQPEQITFKSGYDAEKKAFLRTGLVGFGGPVFIKIADKKAQSDNRVVLEANAYDWSENEESTDIIGTETLVLSVDEIGYHYESYQIQKIPVTQRPYEEYQKYPNEITNCGILGNNWQKPEDLESRFLVDYYAYNEIYEKKIEDVNKDNTVLIAAATVESYIQAHFDVSTEYLRTDPRYINQAGKYKFLIVPGIGGGITPTITDIEKNNGRTIFIFGQLGIDSGEDSPYKDIRLTMEITNDSYKFLSNKLTPK